MLAVSTPLQAIAADPRVLHPDHPRLGILAKAISMPIAKLQTQLRRYANKHHVYLKKKVPPDRAQHVMTVVKHADIPGVYLEQKHQRFYPAGEIFSQIIGFTDYRDQGQEGLERQYDAQLRGQTGYQRLLRDGKRKAVQRLPNSTLPQDGQSLALSLDHRLQYIAYRALKTAVQQHHARSGSVVLLDVRTGEVLAMVNQPSFNPNDGQARTGAGVRNRAITDIFEPGSTMKPFIVAIALETGQLTPDSQIDTQGHVQLGHLKIRDSREFGHMPLTTLLGRSSNEGAAKIALLLDKAELWQQLHRFGFGQDLATGFPAEASGHLSDYGNWSPIDQASLAFGYGLSTSALQLTQAYATLANDGIRLPVSLHKQDRPPVGQRVLAAETAEAVRTLLREVVGPQGTAPQAVVPGYQVAGKTGTVKKLRGKTYSTDQYQAIFVGMAPLAAPRLALTVVIDEPRNGEYYGGRVAGPVFAEIMREALRLLNIAPIPTAQHIAMHHPETLHVTAHTP